MWEEFDGAADDWPSYMERLEHFFDANTIEAEQKKAAFLACIGKRTYGLLDYNLKLFQVNRQTKRVDEALISHRNHYLSWYIIGSTYATRRRASPSESTWLGYKS